MASESDRVQISRQHSIDGAFDRAKPIARWGRKADDSGFVLAVATDVTVKDVDLCVKIKLDTQAGGEGGGLVWRYQDDENYYFARLDGDGKVTTYRVEQGRWTRLSPSVDRLGTGVADSPLLGAWNELRVTVIGDTFDVSFNSRRLYQIHDSTFADAGKVGLWTKSHSGVSFDELSITLKGHCDDTD